MSHWKPVVAPVTLTYSSADAPVFVVSTSEDLTDSISLGMRLRISQATGGTKYFIVVAITNSTITLYGGTDYTLTNETVSSPVFSAEKAPFGFPLNPAKWTQVTTDNQDRSQTSPTNGTWYNMGSLSLEIPIGVWEVEYFALIDTNKDAAAAVDAYVTLSTANNTESDTSMTARLFVSATATPSSVILELVTPTTRKRYLALTSKASYYLNEKSSTSVDHLHVLGNEGLTTMSAKCAYL